MSCKARKRNRFDVRRSFCLVMAVSIILSVASPVFAVQAESTQNYKMISTVEYDGQSQYRSLVETMVTVEKQPLSANKARYTISTKDYDLSSGKGLSFVVDNNSKRLSAADKDLALLQKVNNLCVGSLQKVSRENIGKTWKQAFDLSIVNGSLPEELKFTMTAIELKTDVYGDMIAVRALSEPFVITTEKGKIKAKTNALYLFDANIEEVYMSISVFDATTKMNGSKETLRHEVATYMTDAKGLSADLGGLGKKFGPFAQKVGLTKKAMKIKTQAELPAWVKQEVLDAGQVTTMCAAIACEGSLNPVVAVCIPAAQTFGMQSIGAITTIGAGAAAAGGATAAGAAGATGATVSGSLAAGVPAVGAVGGIAGGVTAGTAAVVGGATAGGVAAGGGFSSSSSSSTATSASP